MFLRTSKTSRVTKAGFVYAITDGTKYKIGHGVNVTRRLQQLQTGNDAKLTIYAQRFFDNRYEAESIIHELLGAYRGRGEWFRLDRQGKHLLDIIFKVEQANDYERASLIRMKLY